MIRGFLYDKFKINTYCGLNKHRIIIMPVFILKFIFDVNIKSNRDIENHLGN